MCPRFARELRETRRIILPGPLDARRISLLSGQNPGDCTQASIRPVALFPCQAILDVSLILFRGTYNHHMAAVTNVTRYLDSQGIQYTAFELPAEKLSAIETAELLKVDPQLVFKTIVVTREKPKRPALVLVPAGATVDLKSVASFLGEKRVHLPTEREAEEITGLQAGGISPLALLHKRLDVIVDESARQHAEIHISGGRRGLNIRLPVGDLVRITNASFAVVARLPAEGEPQSG